MKIFGNRKRRPSTVQRTAPAPHKGAQVQPEQEPAEPQSRLSPVTRATILLLASLLLFAATVGVCYALIQKSAQPLQLNNGSGTAQLKYVVDSDPPPQVDAPVVLEAPKSVNDSRLLNILVAALDDSNQRTDTLLLLSVNLDNAEVGMLSIPRDTFVFGDFSMPKIDSVYAESGARGVQALKEQVRAMFGFDADYYYVITQQTAEAALAATGPISFEIPEEPAYSGLPAGTRTLTAADVMQLLQFDDEYTTVGTEPARVQRSLLQTILDRLLADQEGVQENAKALAATADTDLTAEDLMFFGYLLKDTSFAASFSRALPGTEVTIGDYAFYQVEPNEALELINANFNPLEKDLTVFDLNFRQKTGSSTEGQFSDFGFVRKTEATTEPTTEATSAPTESEPETQATEAPTTEP